MIGKGSAHHLGCGEQSGVDERTCGVQKPSGV